MDGNKPDIGNKLYHYHYGPMTVIASDNKHVMASIDSPQDIVIKPFTRNVVYDTVMFPVAALDCWYFNDIAKIGKKTAKVPFNQGQYPEALQADYSALHPFYRDKVKIEKAFGNITPPTKSANGKKSKPNGSTPVNQAEADAKINGIFPINPLEAEEEKASSPTDG
ncbi:MAG: hypothetical protein K0S55_2003 [Clostridia bacterium]|nr:hypothetical protein [Clostridia bacterium]